MKWAVKRPGAPGTDRNSESSPYRSRSSDDRDRDRLIWDQRKRLSRCLASDPTAEAWSVSHCQISDARRSFRASLVIFWAFLGIRASSAGRATGKLIAMAESRTRSARNLPGDEDSERECWGRDGERLAGFATLRKAS